MKPKNPQPLVYATKHARRRFRERVALPPRAVDRAALLAWERGARLHDLGISLAAQDALRRRADSIAQKGAPPRQFRVYRGVMFVFSEEGTLLTVIDGIAGEYQKGHRKNGAEHRFWLRGQQRGPHNNQRPPRRAEGLDAEDDVADGEDDL
jgi:hypothetical protein